MKLPDIIREKRLVKHLTQEQVATALGISAPAVNKWEKGISYPDITLLPALARLLDTDLNSLLSFQEDLSDQEVALFLNELASTLEAKGFKEGYTLAIHKIQEFPTCYSLMLYAGLQLESTIDREKNIDKDPYLKTIESLYEQVLDSESIPLRAQAQSMLIKKYMERKNFDKAEQLINALPDKTSVDKKHLQARLKEEHGELQEAARMEEERLLSQVMEIQNTLMVLMELALKDGRDEDALVYANTAKQAAELFDLWEYNSYITHFQYYTMKKMRFKTMKTLTPMLKALVKPWKVNASPLYRHIKLKDMDPESGKKIRSMLISTMRESEELDFLKDDAEFEASLKEFE